jgi:glycosyltransferase involved in cell wall biosynthesis
MRDVRSSVGLAKERNVEFGVPVVGSRLGGFPEVVDRYSAVAPPSPQKIEAVVKVLEMHYDREGMMRYVFEKFGGGKERFLSWRR